MAIATFDSNSPDAVSLPHVFPSGPPPLPSCESLGRLLAFSFGFVLWNVHVYYRPYPVIFQRLKGRLGQSVKITVKPGEYLILSPRHVNPVRMGLQSFFLCRDSTIHFSPHIYLLSSCLYHSLWLVAVMVMLDGSLGGEDCDPEVPWKWAIWASFMPKITHTHSFPQKSLSRTPKHYLRKTQSWKSHWGA